MNGREGIPREAIRIAEAPFLYVLSLHTHTRLMLFDPGSVCSLRSVQREDVGSRFLLETTHVGCWREFAMLMQEIHCKIEQRGLVYCQWSPIDQPIRIPHHPSESRGR